MQALPGRGLFCLTRRCISTINYHMNQNVTLAITALTEHAREIIADSFKNGDRIFHLTDKKMT